MVSGFSLRTSLPLCDCAEIGVAYEIRWPRNVTSFTLDCGRARQLVYQWKAGDILCFYWPKIFPGWCLLFSPSVGGSDYWVMSDSPRGGPARTQEAGNPLDYVATDFWLRFLGLFSSWVGGHCVVGSLLSCWGFCELGVTALDLLWRCTPSLLLGFARDWTVHFHIHIS